MAKPKKPAPRRIIRRVDVGVAITGGTTYPVGAYLLYRLDWSDGTSTVERGTTIGTMDGQAHVIRPDLQPHMLAISALLPPIREACWAADDPKPAKPKLAKPRKRP